MSDFRAAVTEGLNLDALIKRMAEKVAARLQDGDQGVPVRFVRAAGTDASRPTMTALDKGRLIGDVRSDGKARS
jgi:hypothetical protein